jgi:hypothetical protein
MKKLIGGALLALTVVFGFGAAEVSAQWRDRDDDRWERRRNRGGYSNVYQQQELNRGYQQGIQTGSSDAQRGQSYSPQRSKHYQRAGSVPFREGFVRGYDQGYRQYAGYRNDGRYGGGYGYGNQHELNRGYQQGLETGASDGQRGQSYDPQRSRHYRNASTRDFREGFVRGYDEGYRRYANGRYGSRGIGIGDILGGILGGRR